MRQAGGHWTVIVGLGSAVPYWLILRAEYESVDRTTEAYHYHRLILNIATYVIAFLFFATIFDFRVDLAATAFSAGIVSLLLGIEVLREEAMDTPRTVTYAVAIGVLLAETAWATHFLPLEGSAAAVFLLLWLLSDDRPHPQLPVRLPERAHSRGILTGRTRRAARRHGLARVRLEPRSATAHDHQFPVPEVLSAYFALNPTPVERSNERRRDDSRQYLQHAIDLCVGVFGADCQAQRSRCLAQGRPIPIST